MNSRRFLNIVFSILMLSSLILGSAGLVQAKGTQASLGAPTNPTDPTRIPHYYGPYPNWANSPQVLADAIVTITAQPGDTGVGAEATATVDPKTGAITAVTVTAPGSGYLVPPAVDISAAGVVPTTLASATATISLGVIKSIAVIETGFGFTAPSVTLTGGNPTPGFEATAQASGGVDNVTIISGGGGYLVQPIVEFGLPNLPGGVQATGSATMDINGVVDGVFVVNPGSGYTSAPSVTIWDGTPTNPAATPATVEATIGVLQIDVTSGGQGYDSAPVVTVADTVGIADKGSTAVATVAVRGAVTDIALVAPNFGGAGYITPGLKKFVDPLPGVCDPAGIFAPVCSGTVGAKYIPFAVADPNKYSGTDYYEIAVVQYREKFSSQLPETLLRGYVQLSTPNFPGLQIPLTNAHLDPALPPTPIYLPDGSPALGVDYPHYLGPTIVATKDKPVRILFRNLLPSGVEGNLFLPVDTSIMGSGAGPDMMMLDPVTNVPMDMAFNNNTVLDEVRNPVCGEVDPVKGKMAGCFTDNRATLHLHGGITPWISDGTPHQWITPAPWTGASAPTYPKGVSVSNVPDMPDPGEGAQTFFYTNQQSARLMFYHDHAWGITRLNVYAGEAAGYLVTDAMEQSLIGVGGPLEGLGVGTPLIIQDKTFVPSVAAMAQQDPTWQYDRWGGEGNLWTPHVYMPAQNPSDPSGMSAFGRWMYGPFFWPPADAKYPPIANPYYDAACDPNVQPFCEPALIPSTPNVSVGMEAFNDTPLVNGAIYPTITLDPKAYRFRILSAANDRFWNLSWYVADPRTGTNSEVALNPAEVALAQTDPVVFPTVDEAWSPKGPSWIQIGTEGGFLPEPVVLPAHVTTWITDPTRFDVGNVDQHSLLLAPAERADVVVDFSQFRGKTLILYNDAPAAFPARVPSYDYYTGNPDLSPSGAPSTLPGYGPNTRTVMQVKISTAAPALAFDRPNTTLDKMGALMAAFAHHLDASSNPAGVFEAGSDPVIVGQAAYNSAYGTNFVASGWCNSPTPTNACDGYARIAEGSHPGEQFGFNTLAAPTTKMQIPFQPKGIHDEMNSANFDEWGRMTANMGLEAPGATPLTQNIILYPYVNPATEVLDASGLPSSLNVTPIASATDGTQIWKITHNGVDTHPLHWHLYDVQLINRVTWDNIIIPPDPNELGWKDTIRVSPLEDTIVAVRPIVPTLPFALPDSVRPLNPMMPLHAVGSQAGPNGIEAGFNNTDALGNPIAPIANEMTNFFWEYVWHCHILSHEEMDMMRPQAVYVPRALPATPTLGYTLGSVILTWDDATPVNMLDPLTWGNPASEIGFRVERSIGGAPYEVLAKVPANQITYTDPVDTTTITQSYAYRVVAYNAEGDATSNVITILPPPPAILAPTIVNATLLGSPLRIRLIYQDQATNETGFVVERSVNGAAFLPANTRGAAAGTGTNITFTDSAVALGNSYVYQVKAVNLASSSAWATSAPVNTAAPLAPTNTVASIVRNATSDRVTLTWTDNSNETFFRIQRATDAGFTSSLVTFNGAANSTSYAQNVTKNIPYYYRIQAVNSITGVSAYVNFAPFPIVFIEPLPAAPTESGVTATRNGTQDTVVLSWLDNSNNETSFLIQRATDANFTVNLQNMTGSANTTSYTQNVSRFRTYYYRIAAVNATGQSAWITFAPFPILTP